MDEQRCQRGLTWSDVAREIGVSASTLTRTRRGGRMEVDGMLMLASESVPTTQVIVVWESETAMDPAGRMLSMSVEVEDVDAAHAKALAEGLARETKSPEAHHVRVNVSLV